MEEHIRATQKIGIAAFVALALAVLIWAFAWAFGEGTPPASALSQNVAPVQSVVTCHKVTPETYNRQIRKLDRIAPAKHPRRRATRRVCKYTLYAQLLRKIERLCRPIHVVSGRVSHFDDARTFTGLSAAKHEGLAINISPGSEWGWSNSKVRKWANTGQRFLVKLHGKVRWTRLIDLGPAGWVNRAIDFSKPLLEAMGWTTSNFPTDSVGHLYRLRPGCR